MGCTLMMLFEWRSWEVYGRKGEICNYNSTLNTVRKIHSSRMLVLNIPK